MNIYPAIDLHAGECVRLYQGRYDQVTVYEKDPLAVAHSFAAQGAKVLHVVDLDGAKQGKPVHAELIMAIAKETNLQLQTGGGLRTKEQIEMLLKGGVKRVILGSIALTQASVVKTWIQEFGGDAIVLALDIRMNEAQLPYVAVHGWQKESAMTLWQCLDDYQAAGLQHVLCTDIQCDGTLMGPNFSLYRECLKRYPHIQFQASGGISSLADLRQLSELAVDSVIVGKALYENKFSLREALAEVKSC